FTTGMSLSGNTVVPYALGVADLNGDGKIDIVVGNVEARPVIYFNGGFTKFSPVPFGDDKGAAYGFAIADLDNDGSPDIAIARSEAPNVVYFGSREAPVAPRRE